MMRMINRFISIMNMFRVRNPTPIPRLEIGLMLRVHQTPTRKWALKIWTEWENVIQQWETTKRACNGHWTVYNYSTYTTASLKQPASLASSSVNTAQKNIAERSVTLQSTPTMRPHPHCKSNHSWLTAGCLSWVSLYTIYTQCILYIHTVYYTIYTHCILYCIYTLYTIYTHCTLYIHTVYYTIYTHCILYCRYTMYSNHTCRPQE